MPQTDLEFTTAEAEGTRWLAEQGLPVVDVALVDTSAEARVAARRFGFPVVVKITDEAIVHKTELGGVVTGLRTEAEVENAIQGLQQRGFESYLIEPHVDGVEVLVGGVRDPRLGVFVVVGWGGTLTELIDSTAMALAPVTAEEVEALLDETLVAPLLDGWRGASPVDRRALAELVSRVGGIVMESPDIVEIDLNPVIVNENGAIIVDAAIMWSQSASPVDGDLVPEGFPDLGPLFSPKAVAVVGASREPNKPGGRLMKYLEAHGFRGLVHPVNVRSIDGLGPNAVASIRELAGRGIDLAAIAVPAEHVPDALDECERIGISHAVIFSAGFGEAGLEGDDLQRKLRGRQRQIRFVGPNSNGFASFPDATSATIAMTFELGVSPSGPIAIVAQSGAIGSSLLGRGWDTEMEFSRWVSTGNEADLDVADFLAYLADDPKTSVVLVFLETIRRPAALSVALERCRKQGLFVVVWRVGRSEAARRATSLHTGAIAGNDRRYAAWLRKHGAIQVGSMDDLLAAGRVLARYRPASGRRVGVVTMSGGAAAAVADECQQARLDLPAPSKETSRAIEAAIPSFAHVNNPLDVTASAITSPEILLAGIEAFLEDENTDLVLVQLTTNADPVAVEMARGIVELIEHASKPLLVSRMGSRNLAPLALAVYAEAGVPLFDSPRSAVVAASVLADAGTVAEGRGKETTWRTTS